jgi:hypothetical protein
MLAMLVAIAMPIEALAWGKGHRLIRLWAVARLPQWQRQLVGEQSLDRLCNDYTSLQDKHAGGKSPELDPYCIVPGVRLSLHDVNAAEPSAKAILWYLDQITFAVTANGKELTRTSTIKSRATPVTIDVALPETDVLKLS